MHKSYQPTLPASNRLLQKTWDDRYHSEHKSLVRNARPSVDTRPPKTFMHLHMKLKKLQVEEERSAIIERDNRILLERMSNIMGTTGRLDHRNQYIPKSLNHEKRRRDLLRVSRENSAMVKRIAERGPDTSRASWNDSWAKNEVYLNNISKYEFDWQELQRNSSRQSQRHVSARRSQSAPRVNPAATSSAPQEEPKVAPREPSKAIQGLSRENSMHRNGASQENPKGIKALVNPSIGQIRK